MFTSSDVHDTYPAPAITERKDPECPYCFSQILHYNGYWPAAGLNTYTCLNAACHPYTFSVEYYGRAIPAEARWDRKSVIGDVQRMADQVMGKCRVGCGR